jgi:hypothetical protein
MHKKMKGLKDGKRNNQISLNSGRYRKQQENSQIFPSALAQCFRIYAYFQR